MTGGQAHSVFAARPEARSGKAGQSSAMVVGDNQKPGPRRGRGRKEKLERSFYDTASDKTQGS